MSYSEFKTIAEVRDRFELRVDESKILFANIPPVEVREFMQQILERNIPLANAINTEKACSELLIAPTYWKSCIYLIIRTCLLYTSPSPRDRQKSRMPSSA